MTDVARRAVSLRQQSFLLQPTCGTDRSEYDVNVLVEQQLQSSIRSVLGSTNAKEIRLRVHDALKTYCISTHRYYTSAIVI